MITSETSQQQHQNQQSYFDENAIQNLKQEVCLNNHQLLQLTYNDQKFYQKLKQLNMYGCAYIQKLQYTEALIYLNEAEKVLQYAASCGKTIQRNLIITTLNNEASLYQKAWQLQKAQSYLQAIIYNISSFFENNSEHQADKKLAFTKNILQKNSTEHEDFSISLWRKKSLIVFYLQFCAVNSQNKNHQNAFSSASKAVSLIKQTSMDFYQYEKFVRENKQKNQEDQNKIEKNNLISKDLLYQLGTLKSLDLKEMQFDQFYAKAVKYIALYIKRLHTPQLYSQEFMETYKKCFQSYSIGTLMQINPMELQQHIDRVNLSQQISLIQKHFKAVYLSVGHFILGTQGRFIATQKYTLDQNQRKSSIQYKQSQIYHLFSIIIATKYLLCQSGYFDHIVNSFRNHYKIDIMQDGRKFLENNEQLTHEQLIDEDEDMFGKVNLHDQNKNKNQQRSNRKYNQCEEVIQIQKQESQIKTVNQIQEAHNSNSNEFRIDTEESEQINDNQISPKQNGSGKTKSTKQSKNTPTNQNTASKKSHSKKPSANLVKSQARLQTQQTNRNMANSHHEYKNNQKALNLLTSREKQNKLKQTNQNQINVKSSRSKKKSEYQFLQSNKKIHLVTGVVNKKPSDKNQSKQQTIYTKKQSDYLSTNQNIKSRSKSKRVPTSNEAQRKLIRRKDSCGDLRKTKKVQEQYGIGSNKQIISAQETKSSRNNLNLNNLKKSKNRKQSEEKVIKLTSPEIKMKKLKSPRNIKK